MPPSRALWAGLYALIMTTGTALTAQYAQLLGTETRIGLAAWVVCLVGGLMAGAGAVKAAWPVPPPPVAPPPRPPWPPVD